MAGTWLATTGGEALGMLSDLYDILTSDAVGEENPVTARKLDLACWHVGMACKRLDEALARKEPS